MTNSTPTSSVSGWFRLNLWLHRWAGLAATLPFLVLCVTGSILIFHEEIDKALGVVPVSTDAAGAVQHPLHEAMTNVLAAHPGERALSIGIDPENHPGVLLLVTGKNAQITFDDAELRYADLVTGRPSDGATAGKNFTRWLIELHAQWFLGPVGEVLGALVALLVIVALFSGVVVYAPYVRRVALGVLRRGRSARLLQLDLHNTIGALTLGWAFVMSATGFLLGFSTIAIGVWQATALGEFRQQAQGLEPADVHHLPVTVDQARDTAARAIPGWNVQAVILPQTDFSTPRHYSVLLSGESGAEERLFRVVVVDAQTGALAGAPDVPRYIQAISLSEPLHFGDYGGLPLKIFWSLCAWLTLFITANCAWLWWDKRRARKLVTAAPMIDALSEVAP